MLIQNQASKGFGAGDIGTLTNVYKEAGFRHIKSFKARQSQLDRTLRNRARRNALNSFGDGLNMLWRRAAAATSNVHKTRTGKLFKKRRRDIRCFIEASFRHGIGQTRIGVDADIRFSFIGQLFNVGTH